MNRIVYRQLALLHIFLFLLASSAFSQVSADFSASTTEGCGPLIIQFSNLSSGSGTLTYSWNFGNGNSSSAEEPSATYINPGVYTVSLTTSNGSSSDTETKTSYITVFQEPTPNFSASTNTGCYPLAVDFTDLSVIGSGGIQSWLWDFGDGNVSTQQNPSHTYNAVGDYDVTLLLIDSNGCQQDVTLSDFISVSDNFPNVDFTADPLFGCNPPTGINFTNNSSGTSALDYTWRFGDGGSSSQNNPSHSYTSAGLYSVTLVATDQIGCTDSLVRTNYINIVDSVIVDFLSSSTTGCVDQALSFFDNSSAGGLFWQWDFGDGNTSTDQNPSHSYSAPGTYDVSLTVNYQGSCQGSTTKTGFITISPSPTTGFSVDENYGCKAPFTATFTNSSSGATDYFWDFGDAQVSSDENPVHDYNFPGAYTVSLTATNASGCSTILTETNYITISDITADFQSDVFGFCLPLSINLSDLSTSNENIVAWEWDFGDGNTSTDQNPSHTYTTTGMFSVTLIIEDAIGCKDTLVRPNYIFVSTPPTATFTGGPYQICAGHEVSFFDQSSNVTDWYWDFGDGTFSTDQNPDHEWNDTGYFDVTLIAINDGCTDTITLTDHVYILPPVAIWDYTQDCPNPFTINFFDQSVGAATYAWDFGDGNTSTDQNPTHTFNSTGTYSVELTVTSDTNACVDGDVQEIVITNPTANFGASNNSGCGPLTVSFTDLSTDAIAWNWDFGDNTNSLLQSPSHEYLMPGSYTVTLVVTDIYGCQDTVSLPNMVNVTGSTPDFELSSSAGCDSLEVSFSDLSTPPGSVSSWFWDFGDGNSGVGQNPSHVYYAGGTYDVALTINDNTGCTYTIIKDSIVYYDPYPIPNFIVSSTGICRGDSIDFINFTSGAISFLWDFGDGNTSTDSLPTHVYNADGIYTISLTATNENGCDSSITFTDLITVGSPNANYSAFPLVAVCPPLLVEFTDSSSNDVVGWEWNFGDSTSSNLESPAHIYTQPGSFDVELVVTNSFGCTDTILMEDLVNLSGPVGSFTFYPDTAGCPPFEVNYEANSPNATSFTWDFGDGSLGSGQTATHTYTEYGEYYPVLILEDINGCSFTVQSEDSILVEPLPVDAGEDTTTCREQEVFLNASGGDTYSWSPSAGLSDPNIANPVATPSSTTKYYVTAYQGLCENRDSITIVIAPTPVAAFDVNSACLGQTNQFTDLSTIANDSIISWAWDFGDGNLSTDTSPNHLFGSSGNFLVELLVTSNNGCSDIDTTTIAIAPAPQAAFTVPNPCMGEPITFTDQSSISSGSISTWAWDLGDGTTSSLQSPDHNYYTDTTWTATLIVESGDGCADTISQNVTVHPRPQVDFGFENLCFGEAVQFSDSSSISSGALASWEWYVGGGDTLNQQNPLHNYANPGTYVVSLVVTSDFGCMEARTHTLFHYPLPSSSFNIASNASCDYPINVNFDNTSSGALNFHWDFGNGDTSIAIDPSTTFDTIGDYTITLLSENQFGCTDDTTIVFTVYPIPSADFNITGMSGCQPLTIEFNDLSGNALSYEWDFGDGNTSTATSPTHIYEDAGLFGVSLVIIGEGGCMDSIFYSNVINVWENPTADFVYQTVTDPDVNGTVNFFDQSSPVVLWNWDLGDGNISSAANPIHQYDFHGTKTITLIVVDALGCRDTITQEISVDYFGGLYVPNAVIPNSNDNGINEFLPAGVGLREYKLRIFDKWGNLIFETDKLENTSPSVGWDGTYNNTVVPQGAYVWQIAATFDDNTIWPGKVYDDGTVFQTGTVMVIK